MQVKGQLVGPHDQSGGRDWLEAAGALTTSKHPAQGDQGQGVSRDWNGSVPRKGQVKVKVQLVA